MDDLIKSQWPEGFICSQWGVDSKYIQAYLDEYVFRFNRGAPRWRPFKPFWESPPAKNRLHVAVWWNLH
jgi:hypothetical protein